MKKKNNEEDEEDLLFTVTVALLVAVPYWLVATALYSAVSLTTHLQERTECSSFYYHDDSERLITHKGSALSEGRWAKRCPSYLYNNVFDQTSCEK